MCVADIFLTHFKTYAQIIKRSAFNSLKKLKRVKFPQSLLEIEDYAFADCPELVSAYLPPKLTRLGEQVFFGCRNLEDVRIGDVENVGGEVFYGCYKLVPEEIKVRSREEEAMG